MEHLYRKTMVMVDLETVSTLQNAIIVSIGAVEFIPAEGIKRTFTVNIDFNSGLSYGLHLDKATIDWWMKQPPHVRGAWQTDKKTLPEALKMFNEFLGPDADKKMIVSEGNVFDLGILYSSYAAVGMEKPWKYWNEMDTRTVGHMFGIRMSTGNDHIALLDAKNQAQQFIEVFEIFRNK